MEHFILTQYDLLVTRHFIKTNNNLFILNMLSCVSDTHELRDYVCTSSIFL